jgi:hypothetical protein
MAQNRLRREFVMIAKSVVKDDIRVAPEGDASLLRVHYAVRGAPGTPYEGGIYHGLIIFPPEYPMKVRAAARAAPAGGSSAARASGSPRPPHARLTPPPPPFRPPPPPPK